MKWVKNDLQQICLISSHQQKKSHCNSLPPNLWNTSRGTFRFSSIFSIVIVNINGNGQILCPLSEAAALRQPNLCPSLATALGKDRGGCIEVQDAELYPNVLHHSPRPHKQPEAAAGARAHRLGCWSTARESGSSLGHPRPGPRRSPGSSTLNRARPFSQGSTNLSCASNWEWLQHFIRNQDERRRSGN